MATRRGKTRLPNEATTPLWDRRASNEQGMERADRRAAQAMTDASGNGGKMAAKGPAGTRSAVDGGVEPK